MLGIIFAALLCATTAAPIKWVHPGVLYSTAQLATMKANALGIFIHLSVPLTPLSRRKQNRAESLRRRVSVGRGRSYLQGFKISINSHHSSIVPTLNFTPLATVCFQVRGPPANGVIDCGPYSHPDLGCSAEDEDGTAAVLQVYFYRYINCDVTHQSYTTRHDDVTHCHNWTYSCCSLPLMGTPSACLWLLTLWMHMHSV